MPAKLLSFRLFSFLPFCAWGLRKETSVRYYSDEGSLQFKRAFVVVQTRARLLVSDETKNGESGMRGVES